MPDTRHLGSATAAPDHGAVMISAAVVNYYAQPLAGVHWQLSGRTRMITQSKQM